jgi:hypothetical protein
MLTLDGNLNKIDRSENAEYFSAKTSDLIKISSDECVNKILQIINNNLTTRRYIYVYWDWPYERYAEHDDYFFRTKFIDVKYVLAELSSKKFNVEFSLNDFIGYLATIIGVVPMYNFEATSDVSRIYSCKISW